jgi:chromosome segregation ATPase
MFGASKEKQYTIDKESLQGIKKQSKVFQAIVDVADILEQIDSIDSAVGESELRLEAAKKEEAALNMQLETLKSNIEAMTSSKAEHLARINALVADCALKCDDKLKEAGIAAQSIKNEATGSAKRIVDDAEAVAARISNETDVAREKLNSILQQSSEAAAELDKLNKAIEALKSKFA